MNLFRRLFGGNRREERDATREEAAPSETEDSTRPSVEPLPESPPEADVGLSAVEYAQAAAAANDARALESEALDGSGKAPCDVCSAGFTPESGYLLTTSEIVRSEDYWSFGFAHGLSVVHEHDPSGGSLAMMMSTIVGSTTPWRVCENCIRFFDVDCEEARRHSTSNTPPPGCGASDLSEAAMPGAYAWAKAYHCWPLSIQVGSRPVTHDPADGTACDFCTRITTDPDAALGMMGEEALEDFEQRARIQRTGPASLVRDGVEYWVACSSCLQRYADAG